MVKKSQLSMEFMITYGWVILIVLLAIGSLSYFGVLNFSRFIPESCTLVPGLSCVDFIANMGGVTLIIHNSMGQNLEDFTINISGQSCIEHSHGTFKNNDKQKFKINCMNLSYKKGQKLKEDIIISYKKKKGMLDHTIIGKLTTKVSKTEACPFLNPPLEDAVDVVVFYTPAMLDLVNGNLNQIYNIVNHSFYLANESLKNSLFPPNMRYRLLGIELFPYEERDNLKSNLIWIRHNSYFQSLRKSFGADIGLFLLGTPGYQGLAYSNQLTGDSYDERGVIVIDAIWFGDGNIFETPAHEIGHILGATHMASQFFNFPSGNNYGYHNQEPHLRRNEAFGLPVNQHNQKVHTIMGYRGYENEFGVNQPCEDCTQLPVFSSPNLWWFFNPSDPLFGYCLITDEYVNEEVEILCQGCNAWNISNNSYIHNSGAKIILTTQEIIDRALPLGVDEPSYVDPYNNTNIITTSFSTDNRVRVMDFWSDKSDNTAPIAPLSDCPVNCEDQNKISCAVNSEVCGDCLPGFMDFGGTCINRIEADKTNPLHDERYENTGVSVDSGGEQIEINIALENIASIKGIELYLTTLNEFGEFNFSWVSLGPTIWVANEAPPHSFSIYAHHTNRSETLIGTESTQDAVMGEISQKNHALSYRFIIQQQLDDVMSLSLILNTSNRDNNTEVSSFGFGVTELRVFGILE